MYQEVRGVIVSIAASNEKEWVPPNPRRGYLQHRISVSLRYLSFRESWSSPFPCCSSALVGSFFFSLSSLPSFVCWGVGFRVLAHRAQSGRVGGSRWGWVLYIKYPCQGLGSLNKIPRQGSLSLSSPQNHVVARNLSSSPRNHRRSERHKTRGANKKAPVPASSRIPE